MTSRNRTIDQQMLTDDDKSPFEQYESQIPVLVSLSAITMIIALFGNLFLVFIIVKKSGRHRLSPVQILILHTCAADVMFACCTILPQMAQFLTFPHFYGGDFLCKFVKYFQLVPMYASPYLLVAISVDRYVAVCKPLRAYQCKYRLVHWLASGAWGIALLSSTPQLLTFEYGPMDNTSIMACVATMTMEQEKMSVVFFSTFAWIIPSITVAVLYTFVCVEVWSSSKNVTSPSPSRRRLNNGNNNKANNNYRKRSHAFSRTYQKYKSERQNGEVSSSSSYVKCNEESSLRKIHNSSLSANKIKTVKLTISIVACNFLLLAPFCLINVVTLLFPDFIDGTYCTYYVYFISDVYI